MTDYLKGGRDPWGNSFDTSYDEATVITAQVKVILVLLFSSNSQALPIVMFVSDQINNKPLFTKDDVCIDFKNRAGLTGDRRKQSEWGPLHCRAPAHVQVYRASS